MSTRGAAGVAGSGFAAAAASVGVRIGGRRRDRDDEHRGNRGQRAEERDRTTAPRAARDNADTERLLHESV